MRSNKSGSMVVWILVIGMIVCVGTRMSADVAPADISGAMSKPSVQAVQTECPVMADQKIDPRIYSDYKGKRVYFCCLPCKAEFEKNPEKYLPRLPQFAASPTDSEHEEDEEYEHHGSSMRRFIEPLGELTLGFLIATVCLAFLRRVRWPKPGLILKLHKIAGICTLCSGLCHAALVILH